MTTHFGPEFFKANRARLTKLFAGTAPIVLTANGLLQRNSDSSFPFRQDSSFWYLTGLDLPDVVLVIDKGKEYLILPERSVSQRVMEGEIDRVVLTKTSGITEILDYKLGWKRLSTRLKKVKHIATLAAPPSYMEHFGMYTNPARARLVEKIKETQRVELLDLRPQLIKMRTVKQPEELQAIQQAIDITCNSLKTIKKKISKYGFEYEIEAELSRDFRLAGVGHSFAPIVAVGINATTPHYVENNAPLTKRKLVVIDTGAEVNHYAADITRTYSTTEPTKRQREVFGAVADVQNYTLGLIKPGLTIKQTEAKIEAYMGEKLRELGLIKSINHETVRRYYPHSTSHYLGLDVHDIGDYEAPLRPGMIITVEPGIYIAEESIGIRIEDDVLITDSGVKVLSQLAPRQLW